MERFEPRHEVQKPRYDLDHLFWTEAQWASQTLANAIRSHRTTKARLDRDTHEAKHRETPPVPLLGYYALNKINQVYIPGRTPLETIDNVMLAIEAAEQMAKAHPFERELAGIALRTVDLARPYWALSPDQPHPTVIDLGEHHGKLPV